MKPPGRDILSPKGVRATCSHACPSGSKGERVGSSAVFSLLQVGNVVRAREAKDKESGRAEF